MIVRLPSSCSEAPDDTCRDQGDVAQYSVAQSLESSLESVEMPGWVCW